MNRTEKIMQMFEMQRDLDRRILAPRGFDPLDEKLLPARLIAYHAEVGEFINERPDLFKYWKKNYVVDHKKALEELVDVWHFYLSIMLICKQGTIDSGRVTKAANLYRPLYSREEALLWLKDISFDYHGLATLEHIGVMLGYPFEDVYEMYMAKNAVNHQRQEEGY